jgi:hypothetical protein
VTGRVEAGIEYAQIGIKLETDPRYDSFGAGWSGLWAAAGKVFAGRVDRALQLHADLAARPGLPRLVGMCGLLSYLDLVGRADEVRSIAEEAVDAARAHGNPLLLAFALSGYGRAFAEIDPARALRAMRHVLACAQEHRTELWERILAGQTAMWKRTSETSSRRCCVSIVRSSRCT